MVLGLWTVDVQIYRLITILFVLQASSFKTLQVYVHFIHYISLQKSIAITILKAES